MLYESLDWIRDFKTDNFQRFLTLLKYLNQFEKLPNIKQYVASVKYLKHPFMSGEEPVLRSICWHVQNRPSSVLLLAAV
ncbi:hypothetical protein IscW_ISCW003770 [Ixodes scapularis]|uniref:Uncharacterized protein n=1 Tax=Ixodes scapularis TaxID=6945 RepID=B7PDU9_IXOSC|nr:hypothetical protein IscW_ISCW003770 [Ixodes scapularis]|eukprot:XP_002399297.1 hypothetical protein IscW_ISCW003770 [Ixodes scapularis]